MSQFVIERTPVNSGLKDMLAAFLVGQASEGRDLKIEVGSAPKDLFMDSKGRLVDPYAILYAIPSFMVYGDLAHPESSATLSYQVTSVGRTDDSAGIMSDKIRRGLLERSGSGQFVRGINSGVSMTVTDRRIRELGMILPEAGLYNVHDFYDLEVQAHA